MSDEVIRTLVREALAEEIGKLRHEGLLTRSGGAPQRQVREEIVSIRSDTELAAFVKRLADILKDGGSREEIEQGRWVFRLGSPGSGGPVGVMTATKGAPSSAAAPPAVAARVERGIISERQVDALPAGTTRLLVGKRARFTPLGRDRLRQRGIAIERTD